MYHKTKYGFNKIGQLLVLHVRYKTIWKIILLPAKFSDFTPDIFLWADIKTFLYYLTISKIENLLLSRGKL